MLDAFTRIQLPLVGAGQPGLDSWRVGRWIQHPQGEIWFCARAFSAVTLLLILVLAVGFILSNRIASTPFIYWQVHACALRMVLGQAGLVSSAGLVSNCAELW